MNQAPVVASESHGSATSGLNAAAPNSGVRVVVSAEGSTEAAQNASAASSTQTASLRQSGNGFGTGSER